MPTVLLRTCCEDDTLELLYSASDLQTAQEVLERSPFAYVSPDDGLLRYGSHR